MLNRGVQSVFQNYACWATEAAACHPPGNNSLNRRKIPFRFLEEWGANANSLSESVAMGNQLKSFLMPSSAASCADTCLSWLPRRSREITWNKRSIRMNSHRKIKVCWFLVVSRADKKVVHYTGWHGLTGLLFAMGGLHSGEGLLGGHHVWCSVVKSTCSSPGKWKGSLWNKLWASAFCCDPS